MKIVSFDLEIAKAVEGDDWQSQRPLGISCAAIAYPAKGLKAWNSLVWFADDDGHPRQPCPVAMTNSQCCKIVHHLKAMAADGYTIVTVNGLGFDFSILAEESGMIEECADLALNHHCDLMLISVCHLGWPVGLDALAAGAGVGGKLHNVTLNNGEILQNMGGAMAPQLWARGEFEAVLDYINDDVRATLETAVVAIEDGRMRWLSKSGRGWGVSLPKQNGAYRLPTVAEMMTWPKPDTS